MVYLFSDETEKNAKFKAACTQSAERLEPPRTKLDLLKDVWEAVLPHRELVIGGLQIETRVLDDNESIYKSSEMSDGERVMFYLIGQCLSIICSQRNNRESPCLVISGARMRA